MIFNREPVLILFAIDAAMGLGAAFGFDFDGVQVAAVNAFAAAVLGVIGRQRVTPYPGIIEEPENGDHTF